MNRVKYCYTSSGVYVMQQPTFEPHAYRQRGKTRYRILIPARFSVTGKIRQVYYDTKEEAESDAKELKRRFLSGELANCRVLEPADVSDAVQALKTLRLAGIAGVSLNDIARAYVEKYRAAGEGMSVEELCTKYAETVADLRNWSAKYRQTWSQYSSKLIEAFGRRIIGSIEADEIREWAVDRFKSPSYFNSALGVIAPAFSWAVSQKMLADNPIERIERMKVKQNDEIDIYSVNEARKLIAEARKMDALTPFAIMLFAGVRPYEVAKLEWEDIRVESSGNVVIWIKPSIAKTRSVRIVHAREKLSHYLLQRIGKGCKGKVCPKNWKNVSAAVREKAGLKGRPDAARHSFASYAIGRGESLDAVREDMGHSRGSDMLFKHYRGLVSADDARDFWSIPL